LDSKIHKELLAVIFCPQGRGPREGSGPHGQEGIYKKKGLDRWTLNRRVRLLSLAKIIITI
jgi:hypothetical protein